MKKITLLLTLWGCCIHAQQNCNQAVAIGEGQYNATFSEGSEIPLNCLNDGTPTMGIWYSYTGTEDHNIIISTNVDGFSNEDTRIMVYSGDCNNLSCIASDDDSGGNLTSLLVFSAVAGETYYIAFDNRWDSDDFTFTVTLTEFQLPMFTTQTVNIGGSYKICVTDLNGDYLDDIVSPGNGAVSVLYQNSDGSGFTEAELAATSTLYMPDWSMAAGDYDKNGYNDLLYGNSTGAAIMLANNDGTAFTEVIETSPDFYLFSQRTNFVDINNDGNLDAFICHDVAPNVYFLNDGEGGYEFIQGGLGDYPSGGNYGSIWIDYDNDGDSDLFIAKCRGGDNPAAMNELHRNDGNGDFTTVASVDTNESNLADMLQTWSAAWGDYDNDGYMDVFVGASSFANGHHKLMHNNGDGTFTDVTAGTGFETFNGTTHDHFAHDFNNDGFIDIFGGSSTVMLNNGDMTFSPSIVPGGSGPIGDLNNDGFLDIYNGDTNKILFNNGNDNNWMKITLEGIESNSNGIGARVELHAIDGAWTQQIRDVRSGDSFKFMSSLNVHFGLGQTEAVDQLVIKWPSGVVDVINNPQINQTTHVTEGQTLAVAETQKMPFTLYPNPAKNYIKADTQDTQIVSAIIYGMNGKIVSNTTVSDNTISVENLTQGTYAMILKDSLGKYYTTKIIKE